jgi:ComF family protein
MLIDATNLALRVLFVPQCAACGAELPRPLAGPVCETCWTGVSRMTPPWCAICGDSVASDDLAAYCPRCRLELPDFTIARSAGRYDGALRSVIHAFKYQNCRALASPLGGLMRETGGRLLHEADAVVPVPLHPWRRLRRGFNQADDLARCLGRPVYRVLRRTRHGPPQASLPAGRRDSNVRNAFGLRTFTPVSPRGKVLVVVDDVMTTGATLNACSRVLLEGGARTVYALTAARAVAGSTPRSIRRLDPSPPRR